MASIGTLTAFLGLDTKGLKKGEEEAKKTFSGIKTAAGALGVALSIAGAWKIYAGAEKDVAAVAKLERALTATGGSAKTSAAAMALMDRAVTKLGSEEVLTHEALASLITKTQDAEASVANFGLVQDVAAKFGMDLGSASDVVAKAMSGQFKSLAQLLPYMKTWASSHKELAGTTKGATMALAELNKVAGGDAVQKASTAMGQIERLKNIQGEMGDELGRMLTGSEDTKTAWTSIADSAERFLRAMQSVKGTPIIQNLSKWAAGIGYMVSGDFRHPGETRGGGSINKGLYSSYRGPVGMGSQFLGLPSSVLASGGGPLGGEPFLPSKNTGGEDTSDADEAIRAAAAPGGEGALLASSKTGEVDTTEDAAAVADAVAKLEKERQDAITKAEQDANAWYMYWKQAGEDQIQYQSDVLAAQVSTYDQLLSASFQTVEEMSAAWEKYKTLRLEQIDQEVAAREKAANLSPAEADALRFTLTTEMNRRGNEAFANRTGMGPDAEAGRTANNWVQIADDGFKSIGEATAGFFTTQKNQWADFHRDLQDMLVNFVGTVLKEIADRTMGGGSTGSAGGAVVGWLSSLFSTSGDVTDTSWYSEPLIPVNDKAAVSRLAETETAGPGSRRQGRSVVVNISTQDLQSFRSSESQIAARMATAIRLAERNN